MTDFRSKLETFILPLISELQKKLAAIPTLSLLGYYQMRIHSVLPDKSNVPDGFFFKWRYLWALGLSNLFQEERDTASSEFKHIDDLVEKIFEEYSAGAIFEPGKNRGSEKEFLARLGLAISVREPDTLGFPEQIRKWASVRFTPFNESYFLPEFGVTFQEILDWHDGLVDILQSRLDSWQEGLSSIYADLERIQGEFREPDFGIESAQKMGAELAVGERLRASRNELEGLHLLSQDEIRLRLSEHSLQSLIKLFGIQPGQVGSDYVFPHDDNPLEYKLFIVLPNSSLYFLDPANALRILAKTFEREILANNRLRDRYLKNRDRATEILVRDHMKRLFPEAEIFWNYYLEKGSYEKDLLVLHEGNLILIECKNSRVRTFKGKASDLLKYENDFENSVQYGYQQAYQVKKRVLESEETTFFDDKGQPYFSIKQEQVENVYIVCVTITPRGPFGTDVSYGLKKMADDEPYPLAVNLFDFDTICRNFSGKMLLEYLEARQALHGIVRTGDELNFAGYFLKYGSLELADTTFLDDEFSGIFDRRWYREQGVDVNEPTETPVKTSMVRRGNRVIVKRGKEREQTVHLNRLPSVLASGKEPVRMTGTNRNKPCPCLSGKKIKHCCGVD